MERGEVRNYHNQHQQQQQQRGVVCRTTTPSEADFPLQWGSRRRLRCVKIQVKDQATEKTTVRVDRRVVRADKELNPNLLHRPSPLRVLRYFILLLSVLMLDLTLCVFCFVPK